MDHQCIFILPRTESGFSQFVNEVSNSFVKKPHKKITFNSWSYSGVEILIQISSYVDLIIDGKSKICGDEINNFTRQEWITLTPNEKNTLGDEIETFARGNGAHKHQREKEMK